MFSSSRGNIFVRKITAKAGRKKEESDGMERRSSIRQSTLPFLPFFDPGTFLASNSWSPDSMLAERGRHSISVGSDKHMFENMSGLGRYPLGIPSLSDSFLGSNQRRDRLDYDDRRFRERERDRRDDDYRRDSGGLRGRNSRDRFSPEPSFSSSYDDLRQGSHSDLVSYPLGHLGGSRSDRNVGRNDRNRNQNRDRYRNNSNNRSQGNRGGPSNQGPGILGAKPGDRSVPELPANPMQVPGLGMAGGGLGSGLTAQLAQQQQQLMAMVQTQSLLAAMQAQANANAQAQVQARAKQGMQSSMGLLPTPLIPRNQSRDLQRQNRKRGRNDSWGGGNQGNKRERFDHNRRQQGGYRQQNRNRPNQQSQQAKKAATPDKPEAKKEEAATEEELHEEEDEATQGEEEVEDLNTTKEDEQVQDNEVSEPPEFNDRPLPKAVNFVGEDVDALMISLFDKKRSKYICQQCKIICNIPMSFHKHLLGKRHARTVLEKQGKELDAEEFKNFCQETTSVKKSEMEQVTVVPKDEKEDKIQTEVLSSPSADEVNLDFVKYTCDTRKTAMKEGNIITISSVTQSRVRIDGFTSGRNMSGCEFVKAVSGFNCRLCKTFIRCGNDVINHIKGKKHQINYKTYIQDHPQYEAHQMTRNKELEAVLEPKEGEEVVLYEVLDKDIKPPSAKTRSHRKDSQSEQCDEVQITRFVVAPQSSDQEEQLRGEEAADLDVDMEGMDHVNEDSFMTDESIEEQRETTATGTDEGEALYDPAEITSVEESQESQIETAPQLEETEDYIPLSTDTAVNSEPEAAKEPMSTTPRRASNQWKERDNDSESSSPDDTEDTPIKEVTPPARRGKKGAARGGARGGATRGKGRGRGARRGAKASVGGKASKAKKTKAKEGVDNTDDVNLIEGFEVIDEIGDGED